LGHHGRAGQAVEQRRLASIGVAYKRNDRKRHLTALGSVQVACTSNCIKLALDARDAVLQQTTVGFDLGFTRAAHEAATATLAFQVSPTANETTALVFEMRKIDLKAAFLGAGAAAKDLQDETSAIKHLGLQLALQIALLNRRELMIHDHQLGLCVFNDASNFGKLARADEGRGSRRRYVERFAMNDFQIDRLSEATSLFEASERRQGGMRRAGLFGLAAFARCQDRHNHHGPGYLC